ncbi:MAG: hypothetical protein AB1778_07970 [Candidatus Bipolaricaulota bacterium]
MTTQIDAAVRSANWGQLDEVLADLPRAAARRTARRISEILTDHPVATPLRCLSQSRSPVTRAVAAHLVARALDKDLDAALSTLRDLLTDPEVAVRRAAQGVASTALDLFFTEALPNMRLWLPDDHPGPRGAVASAVCRAADPRHLERAVHLVRLVEPLLADADRDVHRLAAESAAALLAAYPEPTFEALLSWSTSHDQAVLRGVASALASPAAARLARKALIVLRKLAVDERAAVRRAVASALWRLARHRPDVVRPEIDRWLADPSRTAVAREALRHV